MSALWGNRVIGFNSTSHPSAYNPEWPTRTDAGPLFAKNRLTPICSPTVSLDRLLHDCHPYRSHRSLLHLGRHFLEGWVMGTNILPSGSFPWSSWASQPLAYIIQRTFLLMILLMGDKISTTPSLSSFLRRASSLHFGQCLRKSCSPQQEFSIVLWRVARELIKPAFS